MFTAKGKKMPIASPVAIRNKIKTQNTACGPRNDIGFKEIVVAVPLGKPRGTYS